MKNNEIAAKYYELTRMIAEMEKQRESLKELIHDRGNFSTKDFMVEVQERSRESLAGIKDVAAVVGEDTLRNNGLIKMINYKTIRVIAKDKAAA